VDLDRPPHIVVVAGGEPVASELVAVVPDHARVIAADAGIVLAQSLGWTVDVAVGDFDSVPAGVIDALEQTSTEIRRFPTDKDATDLELALDAALELAGTATQRRQVLVLGLEGGRPDHALANLLVASAERFAALDIELVLARGRAWVVRDRLTGDLAPGQLLSVIPVHGPATVSVAGVRWPLELATLASGTTRGVSNEAVGGAVSITVHAGTTLCIAPRQEESP